MDNALLLGIAVALCGATLPVPQSAEAGPIIQQCRTSTGSSVYTDKPCRTIGARSVPMRGDLATRLIREQMHEARVSGVEVATIPVSLSTMASAREAIGRRAVAGGCARTPMQLAMDLRGAFALGDVNRIAESYHWVGMSQHSANATMQRLEHLSHQSIVDAQYFGAQMAMQAGGGELHADASTPAGGGDVDDGGGVMQVTFSGASGGAVQDFEVQRYAGCYFVRF